MLSKDEAQRIAGATNACRPDWSLASILGVLRDERMWKRRNYREVAIAFAWVATDPESRKPTRIFEEGPWWTATRQLAPVYNFPTPETACAECGQPEHRHTAWAYDDHEFLPPHTHARAVQHNTHELEAAMNITDNQEEA